MIASIIGAVLNIILNYIFIPYFGYCAAGYTTLVCYILYVIGHYVFMQNVIKNNIGDIEVYDKKVLILISIVFMIAGFLITITYKNQIIRYVIIVTIALYGIIERKKVFLLLTN